MNIPTMTHYRETIATDPVMGEYVERCCVDVLGIEFTINLTKSSKDMLRVGLIRKKERLSYSLKLLLLDSFDIGDNGDNYYFQPTDYIESNGFDRAVAKFSLEDAKKRVGAIVNRFYGKVKWAEIAENIQDLLNDLNGGQKSEKGEKK